MSNDIKMILSAVDKSKPAFSSLHRSLDTAQGGAVKLRAALGALGIGVSVAGLAALAKSGIDTADSFAKLSARTDVSVKTLAGWRLAAEQSDTSLTDLGQGVQKLTVAIGEAEAGSKEKAAALQRLGITAKDPKVAFEQLADAVAKSNDPTRTAADLQKVLSESYVKLLPLLKGGAQGLRDSAAASATFAEEMERLAPDAVKFNDELDRLKLSAAGAASEILSKLVPGLADTATRVRELLDEDKGVQALVRAFAGLGKLPWDLMFGDIKAADTATERIKELRGELGELESAFKKASPGGSRSSVVMRAIFGEPEDLAQQITIIENQIATLEKFGDKIYKPKPVAATVSASAGIISSSAGSSAAKPPSVLDPLGSGSYSTTSKAVAEFIKEQQDAINDLNSEIAKSLQLYDALGSGSYLTSDSGTADFIKQQQDDINGMNSEIAAALDTTVEKIKEGKSVAEEFGLTFTSALEDAIVTGQSFSDMLAGLEQDIARLIVRQTITQPLMEAVGGIDFGALFASANGNVFMNSPGLSAYSGSVVDSPTVFPFAAGMGLMGEAGPEAILPLKRGANGKLGIEGGGGGGVVVNVINNASGAQATATERQDNGVRIIDVMVEQVESAMSRRMGRGEGMAPVMERRYGLNPGAGAY